MVAGTGLLAAGKALEPIQKASKSPLTNLPTLLPFAVNRVKSRLGMIDTPTLPGVPPALRGAADVVERGTGAFGDVSTSVLMKFGKNLIDQQLLLERMGDVAIDLTVSTAAIARASRAVAQRSATADHEVALASLVAGEAGQRLASNIGMIRTLCGASGGAPDLGAATCPKAIQTLKQKIAAQVFEAGG
jgi:hypothetical protein